MYRRGGGLAYGGTYSGPIGIILDPAFDPHKYRELPFHSSLCGSCWEVCPVKIDISDQIYKWRRVIVEDGELPAVEQASMGVLGEVMAQPGVFQAAESVGLGALPVLPKAVFDNRLNPWTNGREMPAPAKTTFRKWHKENRENA